MSAKALPVHSQHLQNEKDSLILRLREETSMLKQRITELNEEQLQMRSNNQKLQDMVKKKDKDLQNMFAIVREGSTPGTKQKTKDMTQRLVNELQQRVTNAETIAQARKEELDSLKYSCKVLRLQEVQMQAQEYHKEVLHLRSLLSTQIGISKIHSPPRVELPQEKELTLIAEEPIKASITSSSMVSIEPKVLKVPSSFVKKKKEAIIEAEYKRQCRIAELAMQCEIEENIPRLAKILAKASSPPPPSTEMETEERSNFSDFKAQTMAPKANQNNTTKQLQSCVLCSSNMATVCSSCSSTEFSKNVQPIQPPSPHAKPIENTEASTPKVMKEALTLEIIHIKAITPYLLTLPALSMSFTPPHLHEDEKIIQDDEILNSSLESPPLSPQELTSSTASDRAFMADEVLVEDDEIDDLVASKESKAVISEIDTKVQDIADEPCNEVIENYAQDEFVASPNQDVAKHNSIDDKDTTEIIFGIVSEVHDELPISTMNDVIEDKIAIEILTPTAPEEQDEIPISATNDTIDNGEITPPTSTQEILPTTTQPFENIAIALSLNDQVTVRGESIANDASTEIPTLVVEDKLPEDSTIPESVKVNVDIQARTEETIEIEKTTSHNEETRLSSENENVEIGEVVD
ncbi:hypothetical protein THRCLA_20442, partial [Thraustotheca clavata]